VCAAAAFDCIACIYVLQDAFLTQHPAALKLEISRVNLHEALDVNFVSERNYHLWSYVVLTSLSILQGYHKREHRHKAWSWKQTWPLTTKREAWTTSSQVCSLLSARPIFLKSAWMCWDVKLRCILSRVVCKLWLLGAAGVCTENHSGLCVEDPWERQVLIKQRNKQVKKRANKQTHEQANTQRDKRANK